MNTAVTLSPSSSKRPIRTALLVFRESSKGSEVELASLRNIRRCLASRRVTSPPIKCVLQSGLLGRLVSLLDHRNNDPRATLEATWILTNVACGTSYQTKAVVKAGAIPALIDILTIEEDGIGPNVDLQDQAIWAIGNITGAGNETRDKALQAGLFEKLWEITILFSTNFQQDPDSMFVESLSPLMCNVFWTIGNLYRHGPPANGMQIAEKICAWAQARFDMFHADPDITVAIAWVFYYITLGGEHYINILLRHGLISKVMLLMYDNNWGGITAAIWIFGHIARSGTDAHREAVLSLRANFFSRIAHICDTAEDSKFKGKVLELLRWLSIKTPATTCQAIISSDILPILPRVLVQSTFAVRQEALHTVASLVHSATHSQMHEIVADGQIVGNLLRFVSAQKMDLKMATLETLNSIVDSGANPLSSCEEPENCFSRILVEAGMGDKLRGLLNKGSIPIVVANVGQILVYKVFTDLEEET